MVTLNRRLAFIDAFDSRTVARSVHTHTKTEDHMDGLTHLSQEMSFEKLGHHVNDVLMLYNLAAH